MNNDYNNDELNSSNEGETVPEGFWISQDGSHRAPVKRDERTINDEIEDFVFTSKGKRKRKKKHSHHTTSQSEIDEFTFVASTRSSNHGKKRKHKHKHHHHHHHKKKMKLWKKIVISVICVLLGIILAAVGTVFYLWYAGSKDMKVDDYTITAPEGVIVQNQGEFVVYNGVTYKYNENVTNILMIGVDKRDLADTNIKGTGGQADVNVLMAIDTETGKISLINISRDTMTEVTQYSAGGVYAGMKTQQLCLAYAYGDGKKTSCENQVNTVERLFYNLPIKSYFSLDLDGIAAINDSVGGVDVVSPETIGPFTEGESYHLEGNMAEKFVRTRSMSVVDANNYRMKRQQIYVDSFMKTVIQQTKEDISTPLNLYNAASEYSYTNINASKVCYLAATLVANKNMSYDMLTVPGEVKMGDTYAEFYVDEAKFYEMFLSVFYTPIE